MTKTPTIEDLDAAAQTALLKAAEARNAADQSRAEAEAQRQQRLEAFDRQRLAEWDRVPLEKSVTAARMRLKQAIDADPTWGAVIDVVAAQSRLYQRFHEASSLSAVHGRGPFPQSPPVAPALSFDSLANIAEQIASDRVADEMDTRDRDREAAGEGPTTPEEKR